jgi:hypothetical protein
MGRQITINSITATQGYNVYICDTTLVNCVYLATIDDADLPYTVEIPSPYDTMTDFSVKIVDANNCEIIKTF